MRLANGRSGRFEVGAFFRGDIGCEMSGRQRNGGAGARAILGLNSVITEITRGRSFSGVSPWL